MDLDSRGEQLAHELAALTGESIEVAVKNALRERLRLVLGEKQFNAKFPEQAPKE